MIPTKIKVKKYCASFALWAKVTCEAGIITPEEVTIVLNGCDFLLEKFPLSEEEEEIQTLCDELEKWAAKNRAPRGVMLAVWKSCLLDRLIYGGEELRTVPCPIHKGQWSRCHIELCPEGCNFGSSYTGWVAYGFTKNKV